MTEPKREIIQTKLDGNIPFYWYEKEHFQGRVTHIYGGGFEKHIPIPDHTILCDFCNHEITEFPVPVFNGTHALCPACFAEVKA